jgi:prophage regulatory protein
MMEQHSMRDAGLENAYAYAALLQSKAAEPPVRRYVRRSQLRQIVPLADTTIYEMEQRGAFPKRFYLTPRCPAWDLAEVEAWIDQRRRDTETGRVKLAGPDVCKRKMRPVRRP